MAKIVRLYSTDSHVLPLLGGARLSATALPERSGIVIALYGPRGGDSGGFALSPQHARLLARWLGELADVVDGNAPPAAIAGRRPMAPGAVSRLAEAPTDLPETVRAR